MSAHRARRRCATRAPVVEQLRAFAQPALPTGVSSSTTSFQSLRERGVVEGLQTSSTSRRAGDLALRHVLAHPARAPDRLGSAQRTRPTPGCAGCSANLARRLGPSERIARSRRTTAPHHQAPSRRTRPRRQPARPAPDADAGQPRARAVGPRSAPGAARRPACRRRASRACRRLRPTTRTALGSRASSTTSSGMRPRAAAADRSPTRSWSGPSTLLVARRRASSWPTTRTTGCRSCRPTTSTVRRARRRRARVKGNEVRIGGKRVGAVTAITPSKTRVAGARSRARPEARQGGRAAAAPTPS